MDAVLMESTENIVNQSNCKEIEEWKEDVKKDMTTEFSLVFEDYKRYRRSDFAILEESIAINLFEISNEVAESAIRGFSLLRYFTKKQRLTAKNVREKMEKISGKDTIEMQVIPIAVKDSTITNSNRTTGRILVFRVKAEDGTDKYLDCNMIVHDSWTTYLKNSMSPACIMCYPKDGFLRKKEKNGLFVPNDLKFCEITKGNCDWRTVVLCPAPWLPKVNDASRLLFYYYYTLTVQATVIHKENYIDALTTFVIRIATMIFGKTQKEHLSDVANEGRALTTLESIIIIGILQGLTLSQVISFFWMTLNLTMKEKLESMDIFNYIVTCHNQYSFVVSPKLASVMLEKIKSEMQTEHKKAIKKNEEDQQFEQNRIEANTTILKNQESNPQEMARTSSYINESRVTIQQLKSDIKNDTLKIFLDNQQMKNNFQDQEQGLKNTESDKEKKIIKVMTYMNVKKFFLKVSLIGYKIKFSNGETLDLLNNSKFDIHSRAAEQINRMSTNGTTDLENMMRLTKGYTEKSLEVNFLEKIKACLKPYEIITHAEIEEVYKIIESLTNEKQVREHFRNMTSAEAYRMKTVLNGVPDNGLELAFKMAEAFGETSTWTIAAFVEIIKMEFIDFIKNLPEPPPDTRTRKTEYHEQLKELETAGLVSKGGKTEQEARVIADENFRRREAIEVAREQYTAGNYTEKYMEIIAKENIVDENVYKQYHRTNFTNWNTGGTKDEKFTGPLLNDHEKFEATMTKLRQEVQGIQKTSQKEAFTMINPIFYIVNKMNFEKEINGDTSIPQKFMSTVYNDRKGCLDVTHCAYDAALGRESEQK